MYSDPAESQVPPENFDIVGGELLGVVGFVYYLSYANYFAVVVTDWHAKDGVGFVAGLQVHVAAEARILKQNLL